MTSLAAKRREAARAKHAGQATRDSMALEGTAVTMALEETAVNPKADTVYSTTSLNNVLYCTYAVMRIRATLRCNEPRPFMVLGGVSGQLVYIRGTKRHTPEKFLDTKLSCFK